MISTSLGTRGDIPWFRMAAPFTSALIVLVFGAIAYEGVRRADQEAEVSSKMWPATSGIHITAR
jgi:hypothetical protein